MESRNALARRTSDAEERAEAAEAKGSRLASYYKKQAARKEEIGDIVLSGTATVLSGAVVHGVRRAVDLEVFGIDLGGVTALGMFLTAGLGGGGKYARLIGASGAGVGLEYVIHKMDKPAAETDAAGVDEETGATSPPPRPKRVSQLLKPARRGRPPLYGPNVRTIDVDYEEVPIGAPGHGQRAVK
jgi:hypothetical protein